MTEKVSPALATVGGRIYVSLSAGLTARKPSEIRTISSLSNAIVKIPLLIPYLRRKGCTRSG